MTPANRSFDSTGTQQRADSLDDGRAAVKGALHGEALACRESGWDGFGAESIRPEAVEYASQVVDVLPYGFPMPTVGAEADGHLTLEWYRTPSRIVSLSVSPDGDLHYAALVGTSVRRNGTEPFLGKVPEDLLNLIRRAMLA